MTTTIITGTDGATSGATPAAPRTDLTLPPVAVRLSGSRSGLDGAVLRRAGAVLVAVGLLALPSLLGSVTGVVVVAVLGLTVALVVGGRASGARRDDVARSHTTEVLTAAADTGDVHGWIQDLEVPGGRVDHLALTGAGAFVVTSVWHDAPADRRDVDTLASDTWWASARTRALVAAHGVPDPVRAVVAVWGPGAAGLPEGGAERGDVLVVRGTDLTGFLAWVGRQDGPCTARTAADAVLDLRTVPSSATVLAA